MKPSKSALIVFFVSILFSQFAFGNVLRPETVFGFAPGSDYKLADWDQLSGYFKQLGKSSDRVKIENLGKTEMGNDLLLAIISSPETLGELEKYQDIQNKLRHTDLISDDQAAKLVEQGKTVMLLSCSMHATETGASQMAAILGYELATSDSPVVKEILDNVIILMLPCTNPDGLEVVAEWYRSFNPGPGVEIPKYPYLYNKYTGHDNNRDFYMFTQKDHQHIAKVLYEQWFPEVVYDMHEKGVKFEQCRIFVPPFSDPVFPILHPLGIRQQELIGGYMATDLTAGGFPWVQDHFKFTLWWQGGLRVASAFHNMTCILSEAASCNIASPVFPTEAQLKAAKDNPAPNPTVDYPCKWRMDRPWRLSDIVEQDRIAAMAVLKAVARNKDMLKGNFYKMNKETIEKGRTEKPFAYVLPAGQHDAGAMMYFVEVMLRQDTSFEIATKEFEAGGKKYPAGSIVLHLAQPGRTNILSLMDNFDFVEGVRPYDITGWTLPLQMGVEYDRIDEQFEAETRPFEKAQAVTKFDCQLDPQTYYIGADSIDKYRAVNELSQAGFKVSILRKAYESGGEVLPAGSVLVKSEARLTEKMLELGKRLSLDIVATGQGDKSVSVPLGKAKVGIVNEPNSMAVGWLRWTLEKHMFGYEVIEAGDFGPADLNTRFDCILVVEEPAGEDCGERLKRFVEQGGTLVAWSDTVLPTAEALGVEAKQYTDCQDEDKFACPGAILKIDVKTDHPITYGMQEETFVMFKENPVLEIQGCQVLGRFAKREPLISGWMLGTELIEGKENIFYKQIGQGKVLLIGFEPMFRAQPLGTFKLVFNAILESSLSQQ